MVEQAKYAQANAEQKLRTANQTVRSLETMLLIVDFMQVEALVLENTQLKKTVGELKEIINSSRSSLSINRSVPTANSQSSTDQQPTSSIRQIVREKLHKRSSSDLQQSLSAIDISSKGDSHVVCQARFACLVGFDALISFQCSSTG